MEGMQARGPSLHATRRGVRGKGPGLGYHQEGRKILTTALDIGVHDFRLDAIRCTLQGGTLPEEGLREGGEGRGGEGRRYAELPEGEERETKKHMIMQLQASVW